MRLLFTSHDGLGLGHVRRNLAIASAVVQADERASVLLVSSAEHVDSLVVPPRVDVLRLPSVRKVDNSTYESRRLRLTAPQTWSLRSALIASATRSFAPDVLLADKHPHGAHGELREALGVLHAAGGRAVLGLRDILDEPATVRAEWARGRVPAAIAADYDRVLVYGSRSLLDQAAAYGMTPDVRALLRYVGHVTTPLTSGPPSTPLCTREDRPVVLATAGGGEDGHDALAAFVEASAGAPWQPVVVSGSDAPEHLQSGMRERTAAVGGVHHRFVRDLPAHFRTVDALVTMGGYNTVCEAMQAAVPTVVVPRTSPRTEQLIRATAFADLGLLQCVTPPDPARLRTAVSAALADSRERIAAAVSRSLDLQGAHRAAAHLLALGAGQADATALAASVLPLASTSRKELTGVAV